MNNLTNDSIRYQLLITIPAHIVAALSIIFLDFFNINWLTIALTFIIIYWFGIQACYHRMIAHRSWEPKNSIIKIILSLIGCLGMQGGPISWALIHRCHHKFSDTDKDPHTPAHGKLHAYYLWVFKIPPIPLFYVKDLLKDAQLMFIEKYCKHILYFFLILASVLSINLAINILIGMIITFHFDMYINAFLHKRLDDKVEPINNNLLSILSAGGSLHKHHHDDPSNFSFKVQRKEIDVCSTIIKFLKKGR